MLKCVMCKQQKEIYEVNLFSKRDITDIFKMLNFGSPYHSEMLEKIFTVYCNFCFFEKE